MTDSDLFEATLQLWGRAYGRRLPDDEPRRSTHQIAVAMEHGMTKSQWLQAKIAGRDGRSRRRLMARDLGGCGVRVVGQDYVDPVRRSDDSGRFRGLSVDPLETPAVADVQTAWLSLSELAPDQSQAVALYYQRPDLNNSGRAKAMGVTLRSYEDRLRLGRASLALGLRLLRGMAHVANQWHEPTNGIDR